MHELDRLYVSIIKFRLAPVLGCHFFGSSILINWRRDPCEVQGRGVACDMMYMYLKILWVYLLDFVAWCFVKVLICPSSFIWKQCSFILLRFTQSSVFQIQMSCVVSVTRHSQLQFKFGPFCLAQTWHMCRLPKRRGRKDGRRIEFTTKMALPFRSERSSS